MVEVVLHNRLVRAVDTLELGKEAAVEMVVDLVVSLAAAGAFDAVGDLVVDLGVLVEQDLERLARLDLP